MNMQVSTPQEMTQALREQLRLVIAGRSGDTASDKPLLAAYAAGFVGAELLAMRRRPRYFCHHSEP
jgi:cyanophycinase-like exopeptidase